MLAKLGDTRSLAYNEAIISTYSEANDVDLRSYAAHAMVNKGFALGELGSLLASIAEYERLLRHFPPRPPFLSAIAQGLHNWAGLLESSGQREDELVVYDRILALLNGSDDPSLESFIAGALANKASALVSLRRYDPAIEVCTATIERFGANLAIARETSLYDAVAIAYRYRAVAQAAIQDYDSAISDIRSLTQWFGNSRSPATQESVAWGMLVEGRVMEVLGHKGDADRAYRSILRRFGKSRNEGVVEATVAARRYLDALC